MVLALAATPPQAGAWAAPGASRSLFLEDLTTAELKDRIANGDTIAIIFSGGVEATGPHVALGKHNFRGRAYAEAIARKLGKAVVAPILPIAPNHDGPGSLKAFAGTLSLEPATFAAVNEQVARSLIASGFTTIVLLGDHFDSQAPLSDVAARLETEFSTRGVHVFFVSDGYLKARKAIDDQMQAKGRNAEGHGGLWDTSETQGANPTAVRKPFPESSGLGPDGKFLFTSEGYSGDPHGATAALGRRFATIRVDFAVAEIRRDMALTVNRP